MEFKAGSAGLADALRQTSPPLGAVVMQRYNGLTKHGLPRFSRLFRLRQEF